MIHQHIFRSIGSVGTVAFIDKVSPVIGNENYCTVVFFPAFIRLLSECDITVGGSPGVLFCFFGERSGSVHGMVIIVHIAYDKVIV